MAKKSMKKNATAKKVMEKKIAEVAEAEVQVAATEEKKVAEETTVEATVMEEPKKRGRKQGSKDAAKPAKKEDAVKKQETVYVQFGGAEIVVDEVMEKARMAFVEEGHRASSIKSLRLYIKPEEHKAYYVINEKAAGSIEL